MYDHYNPKYCLASIENYGNPDICRFVVIAWSPEKEYYLRAIGNNLEVEYDSVEQALDALRMLRTLEPGRWNDFHAVLKTW